MSAANTVSSQNKVVCVEKKAADILDAKLSISIEDVFRDVLFSV